VGPALIIISLPTKCGHDRDAGAGSVFYQVAQGSNNSPRVYATSVLAPVPGSQPRGLPACGLVLTHGNEKAQFLACEAGYSALYQGDRCFACVVEQAGVEGCKRSDGMC
jgi:hypothetical protein